MGTDIYGFIEVRDRFIDLSEPDDEDEILRWHPAGALDHYYDGRSYYAFGCLFGVRDRTFEPLAPGRGFPEDASRASTRAFREDTDAHSPSWISWGELESAAWDEPAALRVHSRAFEYHRGPDGEWVWYGCGTSDERLAELTKTSLRTVMHADEHWPEGTEWLDGDRLFRISRLTRRQVVPDEEWGDVWTAMKTLAKRHGPDHVRLVVWFDN
ncbi:hypothetical protein ACFXKW_09445 [Streptomyces sp. NPDC059193]|uniref:hypothetical protein n=1 Tax=Streptomyces sp. NPDC059193 TaxID=3346763 RepID=UPI0036D1E551